MASLKTIEDFLQIKITNKYLSPGRKDPEKNKYYRFPEYFIVSTIGKKWFIIDNRRYNEDILSNHIFSSIGKGYPYTNIQLDGKRGHKYYHQLLINYSSDMVCDHVNRKPFDNRLENLRIITQQENTRNQTKRCNNTSGMTGIRERVITGIRYFVVLINNNDGKRSFKAFNIDKLGKEEALRLAKEQRQKWVVEFGYLND